MASENYRAPPVAQSAELAEQQGDPRTQFEAWAKGEGWKDDQFTRYSGGRCTTAGEYHNSHLEALWYGWKSALAARQPLPRCLTCGDRGWIGGPSFYAPDEGGEQCPDCTPLETIAARQPGAQEAVAVVGPDFTLLWVGSGPISPIVERHGLKRGSLLYAAPPAQGIDLWQLRKLAMPILCGMLCASDAERACRRLHAAMIDQRDAAPGVANA
ncbi:MAG: hypothetical protein ACRCWE_08765 [Stenotrophomonas maltophilia]